MNPPRKIKEMPPVTGPVVSPIEATEKGLLVPNNGTLPPVCVVTGETLSLDTVHYLLTDLSLHGESLSLAHNDKCYRVRLPYKDPRMTGPSFLNRVVQTLATACLATAILTDFPSTSGSFAAYLGGLVVVWTLPELFASINRRLSLYCAAELGSKIEIRGIPRKTIDAMLAWQQRNQSRSPFSNHNTTHLTHP